MSHESEKIDFVMLGCPHYTINQIRDAARLLEGKRIRRGVESADLDLPHRQRTGERPRLSGNHQPGRRPHPRGYMRGPTCWGRLYQGKVGMTDSPKAAYYNFPRGIPFLLGRRSECIQATLKGGL